jgi:hypothetical protein
MRRVAGLIVALTLLAAIPRGAFAQSADPSGAWSWQTPSPEGTGHSTLLLRPDGNFVKVSQLPNGTLFRVWGTWRGNMVAPGQLRVDWHFEGYRPQTSCVVIQGFGQRCQPVPAPRDGFDMYTVTSPSTMQSGGTTLFRDQQAALLQAPIPDPSVIAGRTPVQPNIPQPVMPGGGGGYQTPYDPSGAYHTQNKAWLDQNMRGCNIDQYGRRWGCQQ